MLLHHEPPPDSAVPAVTAVISPMFEVNPESLLKPDVFIFPLVSFFWLSEESITAKKSPSPSEVDVVSSDKSTATVSAATSIKAPAPTCKVAEPEFEPPVNPFPATTAVISPAVSGL